MIGFGAGFALPIALAVGLAHTSSARAADLPAQADFHIIFTASNPAVSKPIPMGGDKVAVAGTSMMAAFNVAGAGLLHNVAGRCAGMSIIDNRAKTFEQQGFCDYADADGDHVYERFSIPVQPQSATLNGEGEWTGGTGKFEGLSGKVAIVAHPVKTITDGAGQSTGEKRGSYRIEKTTATK